MHDPSAIPLHSFPAADPPRIIEIPQGTLRIVRLLGHGKSAYSWEAHLDGKPVVVKVMHDETCSYYSFHDAKTRLEERGYHRLRDAGIPVPELLHVDHARGFLVKEFLDGPTGDAIIAEGLPAAAIVQQLFLLAQTSRDRGWNIDWFPTNFVLRRGQLYYVDYEVNPYDPQWSLERWGLYFWANTAGMRAFRDSGATTLLTAASGSGLPITAPFEAVVRFWTEEFGSTCTFAHVASA